MDLVDNLSENTNVTISGNQLTVLGKSYILPKPVIQKQTSYDKTKSTYITATVSGAVTEAVEVDLSLDTNFTMQVTVSYNRYFTVPDNTTFTATRANVTSGNITVVLDSVATQAMGYQGNTFTLNGSMLTSQTIINSL